METNFEEEFTLIYDKQRWGKGKGSGTGSAPKYCSKLIDYLHSILPEYESVLDLGCGDWQYASQVTWPASYVGVEVVQSVFQATQAEYQDSQHAFLDVNFADLPELRKVFDQQDFDLVIIKDVLMHWPDADIAEFMDGLIELPWKTLLVVNNWRFSRDKSKNGSPRSVDNIYHWSPIDAMKDSVLAEYGFKDVLYYPAGKFKQVARLDKA